MTQGRETRGSNFFEVTAGQYVFQGLLESGVQANVLYNAVVLHASRVHAAELDLALEKSGLSAEKLNADQHVRVLQLLPANEKAVLDAGALPVVLAAMIARDDILVSELLGWAHRTLTQNNYQTASARVQADGRTHAPKRGVL